MEPHGIAMFVVALIVVYLVPGADMVLVLQTGATEGRARAVATALGLALARASHVALAGLGLAALFRASPRLFDVVCWIGAAWLVWVGIQILRAPSLVPTLAAPGSGPRPTLGARAAVLRGLATNSLNPKALLFCSVLLPQFVDAAAGPVEAQFLRLGIVLVAVGLLFDLAYAGLGAALGALLARSPRLARLQRWTFGALLIAFGLRLAVARTP